MTMSLYSTTSASLKPPTSASSSSSSLPQHSLLGRMATPVGPISEKGGRAEGSFTDKMEKEEGRGTKMAPLSILGPPPSKCHSSSTSQPDQPSSPFHRNDTNYPPRNHHQHAHTNRRKLQHLYVLPVLLLEFLALSITRAILPSLLLQTFQSDIYFVMGCIECIRGFLAFVSSPVFGKVSDALGRKKCLFVTVLGTCCPVCSLALLPIIPPPPDDTGTTATATAALTDTATSSSDTEGAAGTGTAGGGSEEEWSSVLDFTAVSSSHHDRNHQTHPDRIKIFVVLLALSGLFSSTFTLTFAYISDTVHNRSDRVAAYGLALATFGLSFTVGPMAGGYLARVDFDNDEYSNNYHRDHHYDGDGDAKEDEFGRDEGNDGTGTTKATTTTGANTVAKTPTHAVHPRGQKRVFTCALILTILDLLYICLVLPESRRRRRRLKSNNVFSRKGAPSTANSRDDSAGYENENDHTEDEEEEEDDDDFSTATTSISERVARFRREILPRAAYSPLDALRIFSGDPLLLRVGQVAFLYYTSLWAVVSTLTLYATKRFRLGPERLGELMSALGLSTMIAEAVLVRIAVPVLGEKRSMRVGLAAFGLQCVVLGLAREGWQLFVCVALSMVGNLVYPSLTSLVSGSVAPHMVGEALGAVNGIKALTEGIGPLVFGTLMTLSEGGALPGWPYLLAGVLAALAYRQSGTLPDENDEEYVSELYERRRRPISSPRRSGEDGASHAGEGGGERGALSPQGSAVQETLFGWLSNQGRESPKKSALSEIVHHEHDELERLLSEIDEDDDEDGDISEPRAGSSDDSDETEDSSDPSLLPRTFASMMGSGLLPISSSKPGSLFPSRPP